MTYRPAARIQVKCSWSECGEIITVAQSRHSQKNYCPEHRAMAHLVAERARRGEQREREEPRTEAWVATNTKFRGMVKAMIGWNSAAIEYGLVGLVIRSKKDGRCKEWDGERFAPCQGVPSQAIQSVDIFPMHHKAPHGITHSRAVKVG